MTNFRPEEPVVSKTAERVLPDAPKKSYVPPQLVRWGGVEDLTQTGAGLITDALDTTASMAGG